ncbi:ATP-dependent DNA ligase, partial [Sphingomonas sp. HMWF008]
MVERADPLAPYNAKRDFAKTAEPAGTLAPGPKVEKGGNRFIVQKHDASRLHWDFRLEVDGVLKSWAVTRGPSIDPDQKRLAVRTEDHPLSYADFEGTIPAGEYGGGTVMLWDSGTWSPIAGKSAKDLEKGHLHFVLDGARMKGEWILIRLKPRSAKEKGENWLLRKVEDAESGGTDILVETGLTSVSTGRTMVEIAEGAKPKSSPARGGGPFASSANGGGGKQQARRSRKAPSTNRLKMPVGPPPRAGEELEFREPQLCTLVDS